MIRAFTPDDIEAVCRLRQKAFQDGTSARPGDLRHHYRQVFFDSPWSDPDVESMVWEDENGDVAGFFGLVPRPVVFRGERLQAVTQSELMVDPERAGPLVVLRLIRELFGRGYDLAIADGATPHVANLWEKCGGTRLWLQSFEWARSLRPGRELVEWVGSRRPALGSMLRVGAPFRSVFDASFARMSPNRFHRRSDRFRRTPVDAGLLAEAHNELLDDQALRMEYDTESLEWLLDRLEEKQRFGDPQGAVLHDDGGDLAGWYLYLTEGKGSAARVVQVVARPGEEEELLADLFGAAWRRGAYAVRGPMDVRLATAVDELHGTFEIGAPWTLCHSPHPEVISALQAGEARLSRLDMEFWMRFTGG